MLPIKISTYIFVERHVELQLYTKATVRLQDCLMLSKKLGIRLRWNSLSACWLDWACRTHMTTTPPQSLSKIFYGIRPRVTWRSSTHVTFEETSLTAFFSLSYEVKSKHFVKTSRTGFSPKVKVAEPTCRRQLTDRRMDKSAHRIRFKSPTYMTKYLGGIVVSTNQTIPVRHLPASYCL